MYTLLSRCVLLLILGTAYGYQPSSTSCDTSCCISPCQPICCKPCKPVQCTPSTTPPSNIPTPVSCSNTSCSSNTSVSNAIDIKNSLSNNNTVNVPINIQSHNINTVHISKNSTTTTTTTTVRPEVTTTTTRKCCIVIIPLQQPRRTCTSQCVAPYIYIPYNPCPYNSCQRRPSWTRQSCIQNQCTSYVQDCSGCQSNWYQSYDTYSSCNGCYKQYVPIPGGSSWSSGGHYSGSGYSSSGNGIW